MMSLPSIFSNRQFKGVSIVIAVIIMAIVVINIFGIGGGLFVFSFNSSLNSPLAIIIAVSAAIFLDPDGRGKA